MTRLPWLAVPTERASGNASPTTIDVTLCSPNTDYDSKLEIFTVDDECMEISTGFYNDDGATCPDSPAPYFPSELLGVSLDIGEYYIVVSGFPWTDTSINTNQGNYEIFISESNLHAQNPPSLIESIEYQSQKLDIDIQLNDKEILACDDLVKKLQQKISSEDSTVKGFNVGTNSGKVAGQSIFHCHIHVIPRREGDVENPQGGVRSVIPSKQHYIRKK